MYLKMTNRVHTIHRSQIIQMVFIQRKAFDRKLLIENAEAKNIDIAYYENQA